MFCWTVCLKGVPVNLDPFSAVSVGLELYTFHDNDDEYEDLMHVSIFNTVSLRWKNLPPWMTGRHREVGSSSGDEAPAPILIDHSAVLVEEETIYIWGGHRSYKSFVYNQDVYIFRVNHTPHRCWLRPQVSGSVPKARIRHSACASGKVMYICGGYESGKPCGYDFLKLDTATMVWSRIDAGVTAVPCPRGTWHSPTVVGTRMLLLQGQITMPDIMMPLVKVFDLEAECWLTSGADDGGDAYGKYHTFFHYGGEVYAFYQEMKEKCNWDFSYLLKADMLTPYAWKKVQVGAERTLPDTTARTCVVGSRLFVFGRIWGKMDLDRFLYILDLSPSLKTLCNVAVIRHALEQSGLPHNIRWELAAMTGAPIHPRNLKRKRLSHVTASHVTARDAP